MTGTALSLLILAAQAGPDGTGNAPGVLAENWPLIAIVVGVAAVATLFILYLVKYLRLAVNLFLDTPLPVTATLQDYTPPEGEIVWFRSMEGRQLRGMFVERPPGMTDRGTIIFCHEFGSDMLSAGRYACGLVEAGYTVFTFDFRGHGASFVPSHYEPRHWPSNYEVHDVLAAVAYVKSQRPTEETHVGILGISRGAGAAIMAAALTTDIRCLVVDGAFSTDRSIDDLLKRWVQIFARIDLARADRSMTVHRLFRALMMFYVELKCRCRFPSTQRALPKLEQVPILFIHGERDAYVPPEQTRALYEAKPGTKAIWMCPDAKHNQAVATDPETYHREVCAFFDRHLADGGAADVPSVDAAGGPAP
ncbi:MAG: alpha/beta fold hydrolase [Planctomycetota bacterium]|nr:alpha/beta fold hydrolase [Planctomycetota bacterium]